MVGRLRFDFHAADNSSAFTRGFYQHFFKERKSHIVRAGTGYKVSAAFNDFHSGKVYILISSVSVFDFVRRFTESGRVEYYRIEQSFLLFILSQNLENVSAERIDIFKSVEFGVVLYVL